jgi:hypothetical protein
MLKCKKGDIACLIDYPRYGDIEEVIVASSGRKYINVTRYPYLIFDANTLYNIGSGGGRLFIGSKQQYISAKRYAQERTIIVERIKCKLTELSTIQLRDVEYQINQMLS